MGTRENVRSYYAELIDKGQLDGRMAEEVKDSAGELPEAIRKALAGDLTHLAEWYEEARQNVAEGLMDEQEAA